MADIKLKDAAKYYKEEPHQTKAWDWLEERLTAKELEGFQRMYRNDVPQRPTGAPEGNPQESEGICTPDLMHRITGHQLAASTQSSVTTAIVCLKTPALISTSMRCRC